MRAAIGLGLCAVVLATSSLVAGQGDKGKDDKFDAAKLVGDWKFVAGVKSGEKMNEDALKKLKCSLTKENFTLENEGGKFVMKYVLDTKKTPIGIKIEITEGPIGVGSKSEGIIELKGDTLKLCYAAMGGDAPKTFESKKDTDVNLFEMKRSK
jgi:uncharacterized protein (TIGR03067 family)